LSSAKGSFPKLLTKQLTKEKKTMGLDMYAHKVQKEELAYWRKHNRLQGWFEREYFEAHPNDSDFNCKDFYLNEELLNKLEEDIKKDSLPKTEGFFYGDDSYTWKERDEMKQYDLQFVANARKAIKEGYDIVYSCWW
jgi:hypothetical protein